MSEDEEWEGYDLEGDDWDYEDEDSGCTFPHSPSERCPECCDFGGYYNPGTEECDFCSWADVCAKAREEEEKRR
jgi:hypothetical protein